MSGTSPSRRTAARLLLSLLVAATLLLRPFGLCFAADAKAQSDLEAAEAALVNLDYEVANKTADRVVKQRALSHEQLVRAYRVLALTHAVLDHEAAARDAFQFLLVIDPEYQGDPNLGPKVQAPFMEARGFVRAQAVKPGIEAVVTLHSGESGSMRVTTRDPTHVAKRVNVGWRWGSEGSFTVSQVPVGDGHVVQISAAPPGLSRLDYYAQAVDDREGVLFEVGSPSVPKSAMTEAPAPMAAGATSYGGEKPKESKGFIGSAPFWLITGAIVIGGGITAGVLLSQKKEETQTQTITLSPTSATLVPGLQCGVAKCN